MERLSSTGHTVGCDYSGIVEEVGEKVEKQWKKGDRIAGFCHGVNALEPEDGAFGEYADPFHIFARCSRC